LEVVSQNERLNDFLRNNTDLYNGEDAIENKFVINFIVNRFFQKSKVESILPHINGPPFFNIDKRYFREIFKSVCDEADSLFIDEEIFDIEDLDSLISLCRDTYYSNAIYRRYFDINYLERLFNID